MTIEELKARNIERELIFNAVRSSGPGGQHVNKVNTKVELRFDLEKSSVLTEGEKELIRTTLETKITTDNEIILTSQNTRSQLKNKEAVLEKFYLLLSQALVPKKKRTATKPRKSAKEKRLNNKNQRSELKQLRRKITNY